MRTDPAQRAAEVAWAAGLLEGEGSIVRHGKHVRLAVKMTDEDVVLRLQEILGGKVFGPYQYEQADGSVRKPWWLWRNDGRDLHELVRLLRPWLGERRCARLDELVLDQPAMFHDEQVEEPDTADLP